MKRITETIGTAVVTILAASALFVSTASAATDIGTSYPVTVTGEGPISFAFQGQIVNCTNVHLVGTLTSPSSTLDLTPTFFGCTAFGFAKSKIDPNSCFFRFTATGGAEPNYTGGLHVVCSTAGDSFTVTASESTQSCVVHIPAQTPTTPAMDYVDSNANNVRFTFTVSGIHSNVTHNNFLCPLSGNSTDSAGAIQASIEMKGIGGKTFQII